ncbi:hypothetical protein EIM14_23970 [Pseudomonas aeruginosa]|uniref:hypothetical protein n=2 Tax=Pseudomonas aeruginosa TaxID=287 RepID=UPI00071B9742|nr:hypothetical protein [Pseudomonas aeruginosa]KSK61719.1 hypothetical protein APA36_29735 [Pseudomonas aeruginosa]MCO3155652.1 hypothetical protein [Pseudomonas aeruginosa]MCO3860454.1 hypothetical protein [Pseudomonas aeruginosa]MCV3918465.1 hypothetical protein [Pseudomonas aeruginosa]MDC3828882.1 hypothetical protein [Pseudomonas aeruginosa]
MRLVWELLRTLWAVGCIPVGALLLVVMVLCGFNLAFFLGISGGADPVVRWLFWTLIMYLVGGGWLLLWVDQRYAGKLKQLAAEFKLQGFQPQFEVFAKMSDAYLGIDGPSRRLLAYPVDGAEHFFRLDEINSWRIVPVGKRNHRLELLTSNPKVPLFSLALKPAQVPHTEAKLHALLGSM